MHSQLKYCVIYGSQKDITQKHLHWTLVTSPRSPKGRDFNRRRGSAEKIFDLFCKMFAWLLQPHGLNAVGSVRQLAHKVTQDLELQYQSL